MSGKPTNQDLASAAGVRLHHEGISEVLGAVNRETQAERNQPCRESCYLSRESSTNSPTFAARRLRIEGLLHQPIDCSRMQRDE
jgi:hypothetical protein